MTHKEKAQQLLNQKYHCSQTILGSFAADLGLDLKTAFKISTCFGGGMRQGSVCGCITGSLLVLGMAFGFYDAQNTELELFGNKKTEEFINRFTKKMNGVMLCREILGKDISHPQEMAEIRKEGLILKKCPNVINISIEILEDMLGDYLKNAAESDISLEDMPKSDEMLAMIKRMGNINKFRRNVNNLIINTSRRIAFIQFDIWKFKIINDLYGEKFGDEVLYFITERLSKICGDRQYYVNLLSDVFMVVTEFDENREIKEFINNLDKRINSYKGINLQLSYGIYAMEDKQMELRQMQDRAAMARKAAKNNLLTNMVFYKEQFKVSLYNKKFIEENMITAMNEKQFLMYLQPKYSISQNKIIGAEALVRWKHPDFGMIFPDQFIPIIEENGFILRVDYFIWSEACRFIKKCVNAGITACPVSVNVSRIHLRNDDCIEYLSGLIKNLGIPKELLELEITETSDERQVSTRALSLKKAGFKLLMDDFGSGYSSLNILLETPFDIIKLDRKFINNMTVSEKGRLILEHVVDMAKKLDLELIAEGVETKEQVDLLKKIGCDHVQGYYYAKPMPVEDFARLLKAQYEIK